MSVCCCWGPGSWRPLLCPINYHSGGSEVRPPTKAIGLTGPLTLRFLRKAVFLIHTASPSQANKSCYREDKGERGTPFGDVSLSPHAKGHQDQEQDLPTSQAFSTRVLAKSRVAGTNDVNVK